MKTNPLYEKCFNTTPFNETPRPWLLKRGKREEKNIRELDFCGCRELVSSMTVPQQQPVQKGLSIFLPTQQEKGQLKSSSLALDARRRRKKEGRKEERKRDFSLLTQRRRVLFLNVASWAWLCFGQSFSNTSLSLALFLSLSLSLPLGRCNVFDKHRLRVLEQGCVIWISTTERKISANFSAFLQILVTFLESKEREREKKKLRLSAKTLPSSLSPEKIGTIQDEMKQLIISAKKRSRQIQKNMHRCEEVAIRISAKTRKRNVSWC